MKAYSSGRSDCALLHDASMHAAAERECQSRLLVDIAEIDARKAYREAGYDSIHNYCVHELKLTEKAAFHRIWAARVAWKFPCVMTALADRRLHQTAVAMLATHLSDENAEGLVQAAGTKTKAEIAQLIAERFPKPDLFSAPSSSPEPVAVETCARSQGITPDQHPPEGVRNYIAPVQPPPLPERFPLKVGLKRETHEKLRRAQDLLAHVVPSGDVAEVLDRALDLLVRRLEKRKCGLTDRPRRRHSSIDAGRAIPAEVRRAVVKRDGGQCTFVSDRGNRCQARRRLEFDHVEPVARGGRSTVANIRLLCRAHNQLMAERILGRRLVEQKIEDARQAARSKAQNETKALNAQLVSGLRRLGFGAEESKRAVEGFDGASAAGPEDRMRAALAYLVPTRPRLPFS